MSTAFRRIRRASRTMAAAALTLTALSMSACTDAQGKPSLFGIPLPTISSSDDDLTDREKRELEVFDSTMRNPSADIAPKIRVSAAEALITMNTPPATERVSTALTSGEPVVVTAVLDAMQSSPKPVKGLLPAAVETLKDASDDQLEKLRLILPTYGDEALKLVAAAAGDRTEPPARRIGPIHTLAAFRSRDAALELMSLLQGQDPQPPEVVAATSASLERLTGLDYGANAEHWRQWWDQLKNEPIENWLRVIVRHLSQRTTELESENHAKTRENEAIALRLTEALRELFLSLSTDEQLERLPALLDDKLPSVRQFALGRVERRLRDSERIPDAIQKRLAERLNDIKEDPTSRLLAARLLHDLNYQGTAYMVAAALGEEHQPTIVGGYLEILAKRPSSAALPQVLLWLNDSTCGDIAADALWTMIVNEMVGTEDAEIRTSVHQALQWRETPPLMRVLGAVGDEDDRVRVGLLLDSPDPQLRHGAAEGLAFAGDLDPLLLRAADPQVYPFVIRRIATGPAQVITLRQLAALAPPEGHRPEWARTVKTTADSLRAADLLAADDMLSSFDHVDRALRADILARVPKLDDDAIPIEERTVLLVRLARLRVELGEYLSAYQGLVVPNGATTTPELIELKFETAILSGRYDEASAISDDALAWVALLHALIDRNMLAAAGVREEIERRFPAAGLSPEVTHQLQTADQRLNGTTITAGAKTGSTD